VTAGDPGVVDVGGARREVACIGNFFGDDVQGIAKRFSSGVCLGGLSHLGRDEALTRLVGGARLHVSILTTSDACQCGITREAA